MSVKAHKIALLVTYSTAIVGMAVLMISAHELVHVFEVKEIGGIVNDVCVLNIHTETSGGPDGYVSWSANDEKQLDYIPNEILAYCVGSLVYIVLFSFFVYGVLETDKMLKQQKDLNNLGYLKD